MNRFALFVLAAVMFAAACAHTRPPSAHNSSEYQFVLAKTGVTTEGLQPDGSMVLCDQYVRNPQVTMDMLRMSVRSMLIDVHCKYSSGNAEFTGMPTEVYDLRKGGHWICVSMAKSMLHCE